MPTIEWQQVPAGTAPQGLIAGLNLRMRQWVHVLGGLVRLSGGYRMRSSFLEMDELAVDAAAPDADRGRVYLRDNGAGKTQLVVRFPTGAVQVIATEP